MYSNGLEYVYRSVLKKYRRLRLGTSINRTPLKHILHPIKKKLTRIYPTPQLIMVSVTNKCQSNCKHCGMTMYSNSRGNHLSTREIFSLLDDAKKLGVDSIYYFGGEPLIRPDLPALIKHAHNLGLNTRLDTNGYLLSEEMVLRLEDSGIDKIGVSIDAADPCRHDALRGLPGLYEKAKAGISYCVNRGIYCYLSTYATKENIQNGTLRETIQLGKALGVDHVRIIYAVCCGNWLDMPEIILGREEKQKIIDLMEPGFVFLEEATGSQINKGYCSCLKKTFICVSHRGEVQPCCYVPLSFGNIRSEALSTIIRRMWRHPLFNLNIHECIMNNKSFRDRYVSMLRSATELPIQEHIAGKEIHVA